MAESLAQALARIQATAVSADKKQSSFRGMLYGPSGTGKTVLAAQIMRQLTDKPVIYIDTSEGYVSWRNHEGLNENFIVVPFSTLSDLSVIAKAIKGKAPGFENIGGLILDEASKMTEIHTTRVFTDRLDGKYGEKEKDSAQDQAGQAGRDYQLSLEEFRKVNYELMDVRDLHIIMVAHQSDKKDRNGNLVSVFPSFSPKIAASVKENQHLVAHITASLSKDAADITRTVYKRVAQVHPSNMIDAKCRINIPTTSVDAGLLPNGIGAWFKAGAVATKAETKPREEVMSPEVAETVELADAETADNLFG